ncbi:MAG TPA: hypothetical protein VEB18_02275 [Candidatus Paceibacterota bacterium]|nr:hypothetical protein [Candidatus Paceibacterota bacterium]
MSLRRFFSGIFLFTLYCAMVFFGVAAICAGYRTLTSETPEAASLLVENGAIIYYALMVIGIMLIGCGLWSIYKLYSGLSYVTKSIQAAILLYMVGAGVAIYGYGWAGGPSTMDIPSLVVAALGVGIMLGAITVLIEIPSGIRERRKNVFVADDDS